MTKKELDNMHWLHSLVIDNKTGLHYQYVATHSKYIEVSQGGFTTFGIEIKDILTDRYSCFPKD